MKNNFAQFGKYLRFICRRERIISPVWIIILVALSVMFAALYPALLPSQAEITNMAVMMSAPSMTAMMGNVYGFDNLTQASVMTQECLVWFLIAIAIMNIYLVNRHTRVDEELGRLEMFRALPVGRQSGNLSTIIFALAANALIAILSALGLMALNIGGTDASGAFAYGFAIGAVGFLFAGITLLLAQIFSTSHGVTGLSMALLGVFYIMRALGDVRDNALSYISPLGLALKVEAFYADKAYPIIIIIAEGIVLCAAALIIGAIRDHGAGVVPARKGRAHASVFLRTPFGLAWRILKGTVIGWGVTMLLLGASYGSVCQQLNDLIANNEIMKQIIGADAGSVLLDNYVAMIFVIMSMVCAVPVVLSALKIRSEEKRGRLEQIFAKPVQKVKFYLNFILIGVFESIIMEVCLSIGMGAASGGRLNIPDLLKAGLTYLPAIWAFASIAVFLTGLLPKLSGLVWAMFGYTFIILYFGRLMDVPEWAMRITPFGNIPQLPLQEFTIVPLIVLSIIAVLLCAIGVTAFLRRDIG